MEPALLEFASESLNYLSILKYVEGSEQSVRTRYGQKSKQTDRRQIGKQQFEMQNDSKNTTEAESSVSRTQQERQQTMVSYMHISINDVTIFIRTETPSMSGLATKQTVYTTLTGFTIRN